MNRQHLSWTTRIAGVLAMAAAVFALPAQAQFVGDVGGTTNVDGGETVFDPVIAYEWNSDGDFEGWAPNPNINNATVSGGAMSGESLGDGSFPAGADPFFNGPGGFTIGDGPGEVDRIQFAAQFNQGAPTIRTEMFFFASSGPFGSSVWAPANFPAMTDGNQHVYNLDFDSSSAIWGLEIAAIRLDPVADNQNAVDTFAYDYLRLGRQQPIPEPVSLGLALLGCLGLSTCRRR